jgi:hypothetical protein
MKLFIYIVLAHNLLDDGKIVSLVPFLYPVHIFISFISPILISHPFSEQDANWHVSISSLFPCMLLKP